MPPGSPIPLFQISERIEILKPLIKHMDDERHVSTACKNRKKAL